jgi:cytochrome c
MKRPIIVLSITVLCACGGSQTQEPESAPGADETSAAPPSEGGEAPIAGGEAPQTFAEQVSLGQELYGAHCASCHGDSGEGSDDGPPVVGLDKGALPLDPPAKAKDRKTQFKTVADVADFVVKNMPAKKPGTLAQEQYWAILAFDLKANGIDLGDKKLDATVAPTLELPRK